METVGDRTLLCGGGSIQSICDEFTPNSPHASSTVWSKYADLKIPRYEHTSWVSSSGLVIVGGYDPLGEGAEKSAELVKGDVLPFSLPNIRYLQNQESKFPNSSSRDGCAITDTDTDTAILTGGQFTQFKASRYNLQVWLGYYYSSLSLFSSFFSQQFQGLVEELPTMNRARSWHSCGSYKSDNNLVSD